MPSIADLEAELARLKAARPASGASEVRFGDRWRKVDIAAQDARIKQLEADLRRERAAGARRPVGVRF